MALYEGVPCCTQWKRSTRRVLTDDVVLFASIKSISMSRYIIRLSSMLKNQSPSTVGRTLR